MSAAGIIAVILAQQEQRRREAEEEERRRWQAEHDRSHAKSLRDWGRHRAQPWLYSGTSVPCFPVEPIEED